MLYRSSSLYQPESDEDEDTQENIGDEKEEESAELNEDTDAERTYSVEEDVKEDREEEQQYTSDSASEIEEEEEQEVWSTWHFPPHNDANLPFVILCTFQNLLMWFSVH